MCHYYLFTWEFSWKNLCLIYFFTSYSWNFLSTFLSFSDSFWDSGLKSNFQKHEKIIQFSVAENVNFKYLLLFALMQILYEIRLKKEILGVMLANGKLGQLQALILVHKCWIKEEDRLRWSSGNSQRFRANKSPINTKHLQKDKKDLWHFHLAQTHSLPKQWKPISLVPPLSPREGAEET